MLSFAAFVVAATTLVEVDRGLHVFTVFGLATWLAMSELANVLDAACDRAWDWEADDGTGRPSWSDPAARRVASGLGEVIDRLERPIVREPIGVGSGIEVVEIVDDPFGQ